MWYSLPLLRQRTSVFAIRVTSPFLLTWAVAAQSTLTFQEGASGYFGTQDTGVRSTEPSTNAGQFSELGWNYDQLVQSFQFTQGTSGYSGTQDIVISQAAATTNTGSWTYWGWDTDALGTSFDAYTLIRFDSIIGPGSGQIPSGSNVTSAALTYECFNTGGNATVHEMTSSWNEGTTWSSFNFGYNPAPTSTATGTPQGVCDLTASVSSMAAGSANLGWVFIPQSSDGVEARSSESTIGARPTLTVETTELDIAHSLIRFDGIIGSGPNQIPIGSTVHSATLQLQNWNVGDPGDVRPMLGNWSEQTTWNAFQSISYGASVGSFPGGSGAQTVDVTTSVQAFALGTPNLGWAILGLAGDGVEFYSSEVATVGLRPRLEVTFTAPCVGAASNYCVTSPNNWGPGAQIGAIGSTNVTDNNLVLIVTGANPSGFGLFFCGQNATQSPGGNGTLCVGSGFQRLPVVQSNSAGIATYAMDFPSLVQPISNGETWNFQYWLRDIGGVNFNFSNALAVTFCE